MPSSRPHRQHHRYPRQQQPPVESGHTYNEETFLPLTNQDVEVLYTIVTTAQRLHHSSSTALPPYRALFTAYDHVLANRRIDPNQDRVYFRFLLHMRGVDSSTIGGSDIDGTQTLYGRFETLLAGMGIQLEVDEGGTAGVVEGDDLAVVEDDEADAGEYGDDELGTPGLPPLSRRASFDESTLHHPSRPWDDGDEEGGALPRRRYSRATGAAPRGRRSSSRASDVAAPFDGRRRASSRVSDTAAFPRRRLSSDRNGAAAVAPSAPMHSGFPHRGRLNSTNLMRAAEHVRRRSQKGHGRARSQSSQGSLRITRTEEIQRPAHVPGIYDVDDLSVVRSRRSSISGPAPDQQHFVPPEMLYRPSPTQMLADADTFLYARTLFTARRALLMWRDQAMALREREVRMEEAAELFNRKKRADAVFESLSVTAKARRVERETERFYEHNYQRVEAASLKFSMWKAFSHWYANTALAIELTNRARDHIIKKSIWNAWYEQTVIEHEKVRRFTITRYFKTWQRRYKAIKENEEVAEAAHATNVIQNTLLTCFWEFTERKAASLYDQRLLPRVWMILIDRLAFIKERQEAVALMVRNDIKSRAFHRITNKMLNLQSLEPSADDFRKQKLLTQAFGNFKVKARLQPLERQLAQRVLQSHARDVFTVWHVRANQSVMATKLDRRRILGNAVTAWNDNLRCSALGSRIDARVVLEALRKWLLEARAALYIRVREARTTKRLFGSWLGKVQDQTGRLARAERLLIAFQDAQLKRKALSHLRDVLGDRTQREAQALALYEPRLLKKTWPKLVEQHQHLQKLEQWGSHAQFYTVVTHALKRWKESTHQSQKIRRREAYATIRRRTKLSMARRAFERWRGKTLAIEFMERQALEMQENAVLRISMRQLDHWHDKTASATEMAATADDFRNRKLATRAIDTWIARLQTASRDQEKAAALLEMHVATEASVCMKKLNWRLFQVRQQAQSGYALAERNFEKHVKNMLRHWAERMHQGRQDRELGPVPTFDDEEGQPASLDQDPEEVVSDASGERETGNDGADIARNEQWTPFDSSALDVGDLKLNLDFDSSNVLNRPPILQPRPPAPARPFSPDRQQRNPFATTIRNPSDAAAAVFAEPLVASTPIPAYLRSPSKRSTVKRAAKARERLAALSSFNPPEGRPPHPLSQTVRAAPVAVLPVTSSFDSGGARSSTAAAAPSHSNSTFALNTNTGSTTPMAAPAGFGMFGGGGGGRGAPGTAPPAMMRWTASVDNHHGDGGGGGADSNDDNNGGVDDADDAAAFVVPGSRRNFGASTMLAATPRRGAAADGKSAITPFARKLTAQGYYDGGGGGTGGAESARRGSRGVGTAAMRGAYGGVGLGLASGLGFGGFEDIKEDENSPRDGGGGGIVGRRESIRGSSP